MKKVLELTQGNKTIQEVQKELFDEVEIMIDSDVVEIVTNGNLGSVLQDCMSYELVHKKIEKDLDDKLVKYSIGQIYNVQLYIDAHMSWEDNRILFKKDNNTDELEIIDNDDIL